MDGPATPSAHGSICLVCRDVGPETRKGLIERLITAANADRAVRTVEKLKDVLIEELEPEQKLGLSVDGWSGSARPAKNPFRLITILTQSRSAP